MIDSRAIQTISDIVQLHNIQNLRDLRGEPKLKEFICLVHHKVLQIVGVIHLTFQLLK